MIGQCCYQIWCRLVHVFFKLPTSFLAHLSRGSFDFAPVYYSKWTRDTQCTAHF